ncbi:MAG: hypothetical protein BEN19_06180 [Epulopiscium sp. Nuni2H_MBin003]|nr:MAG: hypothetical protein BEN19_06180 [Epulopiscium sp. Nuni2H_MBin003]
MINETTRLENYLHDVIRLLTQVETITLNESQILCNSFNINNSFNMMEDMAKNKEELTENIQQIEAEFEELYITVKPFLIQPENKSQLIKIKGLVNEVLRLRESIIASEKSNVETMEKDLQQKLGVLEIKKKSTYATQRYKAFEKI